MLAKRRDFDAQVRQSSSEDYMLPGRMQLWVVRLNCGSSAKATSDVLACILTSE